MPILDISSGVLPLGILEVGLESDGDSRWQGWCVYSSGATRRFAFADGADPQNWLAYVLMSEHGFGTENAATAANRLFEGLLRFNRGAE